MTQEISAEEEEAARLAEEEAALQEAERADEEQRTQAGAANGNAGRGGGPVVRAFANDRDMARWFVRFVGYIEREERDPTAQIGDFVITGHQRLKGPGTRRSTMDALAETLSMRAWGKGDDVDSFYEGGQLTRWLPVPAYLHPKPVLKGFRVHMARGESNSPRQLTWEELVEKLEAVLTELRQSGAPSKMARKLARYLDDPAMSAFLETAYESSISLKLKVPHWAQARGVFNLDVALAGGKCYWVTDRNRPEDFTHRYRGFLSPTKKWLDERVKEYFDNHPKSAELKALLKMTLDAERDEANPHHFGAGSLRQRGFNELWCPDWFDQAARNLRAENLRSWKQAWRLRYHFWNAYQQAFVEYVLDFRHCVEANRVLEEGRANPTGEVAPNAVCKVTDLESWDLRRGEPYGPAGRDGYFNWFVQSPPSFQYYAWQLVEQLIQYRRTYDGQTEVERIEALERVLNMLSWVERLPRVWKDGKIYWAWLADPEHEKNAPNGHCQGCQHWDHWVPIPDQDPDAEFSDAWGPDEEVDPAQYAGWIRQECQVHYATRQEMQLLRKVIFTHNVGSGHTDVYFHSLLRDSDAVTDRMSYLGGGNENFDWRRYWWVPGVFTYGTPLMGRRWLWGHLADMADRGVRLPYNSIWLRSGKLRVAFQGSRVDFETLLGLNNTDLGIDAQDVRKNLKDIFNWEDLIVFPNGKGETKLGSVDRLGREWVDFDPAFNPEQPKYIFFNDPAFHVDPDWFNNRSLYDNLILKAWVEAFEHIFGKNKQYRMSFPGTEDTYMTPSEPDPNHPGWGTHFRSHQFWMYLVANYGDHKVLSYDFWYNQEVGAVVQTVLEKMVGQENAGIADLRPLVLNLTDGLPDTFEPFIRYFRLRADQSSTNFALFLALNSNRGLTFGTTEKLEANGFGRGISEDPTEEYSAATDLSLLALWSKYGDRIQWLLRAHTMKPDPIDPVEVRQDLAKELHSGNMNWEAVKVAAYFFGKFGEWLGIQDLTYDQILPNESHHSHQFEDWFDYSKMGSLIPGLGDDATARINLIRAHHEKIGFHVPRDRSVLSHNYDQWELVGFQPRFRPQHTSDGCFENGRFIPPYNPGAGPDCPNFKIEEH